MRIGTTSNTWALSSCAMTAGIKIVKIHPRQWEEQQKF